MLSTIAGAPNTRIMPPIIEAATPQANLPVIQSIPSPISEFYSVPKDIRVEFLALIRKLRQFSQQFQSSFPNKENKKK